MAKINIDWVAEEIYEILTTAIFNNDSEVDAEIANKYGISVGYLRDETGAEWSTNRAKSSACIAIENASYEVAKYLISCAERIAE